MIYIEIYLLCLIITNILIWLAIKRGEEFNLKYIVILNIFSPLVLSSFIIDTILPKKRYQTFFNKNDTPFAKEFQPNKKYHIVWKRMAYKEFLGHKVVKIKLLGIITIFNKTEEAK